MLREIYPALALGLLVSEVVYGLLHIPEHGVVSFKVAFYAAVLAALQAKKTFRRKS